MGYACPVCETPERDAEHLANHLAFTAMLHGGDHETWLDDHAPGWEDGSPDDLAATVAERAPEAAVDGASGEAVAERGHGPGRDHGHGDLPPGAGGAGVSGELDAEARQALADAREMTRAMLGEGDGEEGGGDTGGDVAGAGDGSEGNGDDGDDEKA